MGALWSGTARWRYAEGWDARRLGWYVNWRTARISERRAKCIVRRWARGYPGRRRCGGGHRGCGLNHRRQRCDGGHHGCGLSHRRRRCDGHRGGLSHRRQRHATAFDINRRRGACGTVAPWRERTAARGLC